MVVIWEAEVRDVVDGSPEILCETELLDTGVVVEILVEVDPCPPAETVLITAVVVADPLGLPVSTRELVVPTPVSLRTTPASPPLPSSARRCTTTAVLSELGIACRAYTITAMTTHSSSAWHSINGHRSGVGR